MNFFSVRVKSMKMAVQYSVVYQGKDMWMSLDEDGYIRILRESDMI